MAPTRGSDKRSNLGPPRRSRDEEPDKWLSADYHRRLDFKCPRQAPEPAPQAYG